MLRLPLIVPVDACRSAVPAMILHSRSDCTSSSMRTRPMSEFWRGQAAMQGVSRPINSLTCVPAGCHDHASHFRLWAHRAQHADADSTPLVTFPAP
jgi:hypothetical protein